MKQIIKDNEPQEVIDWKALANDDWQPNFDELSGAEKRAMRQSLLKEQGSICCYCNQDISNDDFHIEHFRPQETFEALELEYSNLHVSCLKNKKPGTPSHCGDAKKNWFDARLTLSPLDNHEASFKYLANGGIKASIQNASDMIDELNLKEESLKAKRQAEISGILDEDFISNATPNDLVNLYRRISQKVDDKYQPFIVAIQQQIKQLLTTNVAANL
ncbi:hypothetical protein PNIG_a2503 [Pseudoalteromonas nigrifaciens]|uniref:TIGR02646 family protein n=1 Tax=Pseudoalteromonas nigrifaciens TaxID=28109 RepID=A0AAC9XYA7_9GAMM|nr:retron system putative HNH endonuclease [Pseudoalteromonas nigrifaciens]ASM54513.1 hypothetical protein PNIG_a2503 [Pseudoalteromonas nigrifaciens]GEN42059.1 hypothetical protein PNI02_15250 [Pseudoalteromonas nigrifaciens]SUC51665.1 Uncharacterised protein [Pseudoalteromonas nigrifaciens]